MKKIFLLIPVLALSLLVNATTWEIGPTTPQSSDNIRRTVRDKAQNGDIIVLADGTYTESEVILFDKSVTLMAAEGAHPVIAQHYYSKVTNGADVKFIGIKFDGSIYPASDHCFYPYDDTAGNELHFENCEFTGFASYVIYNGGGTSDPVVSFTLDSLIINNCYFHNNTKSCVIFFKKNVTAGNQSVKGVIVTNSTFANNATTADYSTIAVHNQTESRVEDVELKVDHCTFYNNPTKDTDHSAIRSYKSTKVTVSNCIFAHPTSIEYRATSLYGGSISNCLTWNLTKDASQNAHRIEVWTTPTEPLLTNNFTANPLFTNGTDLTLQDGSPALFAATDNSHLGDPRWWPAISETDFVAPAYKFTGAKAALAGNIWKTDDANKFLYGDGENYKDYGTAQWEVRSLKAGDIQVTLNVASTSTSHHQYKVEVFDANNAAISGTPLTESGTGTSGTGNIELGKIHLDANAVYRVKLSNLTEWSSATIEGVTFTYTGGDIINMAGTANVSDAWFSDNGTRADGKITFPGSTIQEGWVKWNVKFKRAGNYKAKVNMNVTTGHNYTVALYRNASDPSPITFANGTDYDHKGTPIALDMGEQAVEAGTYILKVTNGLQNSDAELLSVTFSYNGGGTIDVPATLLPEDAALSEYARLIPAVISTDPDTLTLAPIGGEGHASDADYTVEGSQYVKWSINVAKAGKYKITANTYNFNGHNFRIILLNENETATIISKQEVASGSYDWHNQDGTLWQVATDVFDLAAGKYVVMVQNFKDSKGRLLNVEVSYEGGAVIEVPENALLGEDAIIVDNGELKMSKLANGDLVYGNNETPLSEYAYWNILATEAGSMTVTLNLDPSNGSGHNYLVELYDGSSKIDFAEEGTDKWTKGNQDLAKKLIIPTAGSYTIRLTNQTQYSTHIIKGITLTPASIELDENADNSGLISTEAANPQPKRIALKRSLTAGMFNTFCVPFAISADEMARVFSGAQIWGMTDATLDGDVLNLVFDDVASMEAGKPYLIKPATAIVNPEFRGVTISVAAPVDVVGAKAKFIGLFSPSTIPVSEYNLFLGPDDTLYFPEGTEPKNIKGIRGWFKVGVPSSVISRARIVQNGQETMAIDLVGSQNNGAVKTIENGQLVIIRDGVRYNVMGIRIQ